MGDTMSIKNQALEGVEFVQFWTHVKENYEVY